jgi:predicted DNA-binding transcriptional regulator YafY
VTQADLRWGVERRLEYIEFRLFWSGGVNRSDIIDQFDVSVPQASKDLTLYQELAPDNAVYDKSAKRYVAAQDFTPRFLSADPYSYLSRLRSLAEGLVDTAESWIPDAPSTDVAMTPRRKIGVDTLRAVLNALRTPSSIEVLYQSMNPRNPEPLWRRITPHAFGFDGLRWHVRAYCHREQKFRDFLLPRILGVREPGAAGLSGSADDLWEERFSVEIEPHPALTQSQREVVAMDYGMEGGKTILQVRYAMLFYVLKRLGLLGDAAKQNPKQQHIVLHNGRETEAALARAGYFD